MPKKSLLLFLVLLSGCITTSREGEVVNSLKGKTLAEARARLDPIMGAPIYPRPPPAIIADAFPPDMDRNADGTITYIWQRDTGYYDVTRPAGGYVDTSQGRPIVVENYQNERTYTACRVTIRVDRQDVIVRSSVAGCGSSLPF
ncbi:hypothetical protein [Azospirillum picis]|uniref:Lipoprotein n=1 Tax=Azospirillum picis TaxID=488438 RepID=A0ABU0MF18_9PROT|nr:hypothetical protein [Azospirillum picis]MBP2298174.1 hypothetical protein [Azospirillum picis]MDQ0532012.1 hypothetical protein [Azospirillum picis]